MVAGAPLFLPAAPLQYLHRLQAQNVLWGDDIQLVGLHVLTPGARLVTLQPDISGEAPSWTELHSYLCEEQGYRRLDIPPMGYYKSASYLREDVAMFDVHPANFVRTREGVILPIDVILQRFSDADLAALLTRLL